MSAGLRDNVQVGQAAVVVVGHCVYVVLACLFVLEWCAVGSSVNVRVAGACVH